MFESFSIKGVVVGSITVLATNVMLSIFMPLVFSDLVRTGQMDILIVGFWPNIYTLANLAISGVFGIYICSVVAQSASWPNAFGVILVSVLLAFVLNQPASEWSSVPPTWFSVASYFVLIPTLIIGHLAAIKSQRNL